MKRMVLVMVLAMLVLAPAATFADMGVGIVLGEPTGLSFRIGNFPVIGIGWSFLNRIDATVDYWIINGELIDILDWYLGAGLKLGLKVNQGNDNTGMLALGIRVPVGVQWWPIERLEVFGEVAPGLSILPEIGFGFGAGIGVRYFF